MLLQIAPAPPSFLPADKASAMLFPANPAIYMQNGSSADLVMLYTAFFQASRGVSAL
jgi:hypothetical protein